MSVRRRAAAPINPDQTLGAADRVAKTEGGLDRRELKGEPRMHADGHGYGLTQRRPSSVAGILRRLDKPADGPQRRKGEPAQLPQFPLAADSLLIPVGLQWLTGTTSHFSGMYCAAIG